MHYSFFLLLQCCRGVDGGGGGGAGIPREDETEARAQTDFCIWKSHKGQGTSKLIATIGRCIAFFFCVRGVLGVVVVSWVST
jgi:hypothetical protein